VRIGAAAVICSLLASLLLTLAPAPALGAELPSGFQSVPVIEDLRQPTALQFSADGRVFVAEKAGRIRVYESLADESPGLFADLRTQVYDSGDRGLLGLALDPEFPVRPYVYVLYSHDAPIGGTAPFWGEAGQTGDDCPDPPGSDTHGCVISGRLSRLTAVENQAGAEQVLIEDWCQQFSSHSIGDIHFDGDGALYVSGGDGASYVARDYGQFGHPQVNPCGDPPAGVGGAMTPPTAEGGSLRSQDIRTLADPTGLNGTVIRVDPDTGEGLPGNPMEESLDANARRIVAFGLRNPFRFAVHPDTHEVYVGNVGAGSYEEIDRLAATSSEPFNSGWPCYEGDIRPFNSLDLNLCESLYAEPGSNPPPFFSYNHDEGVFSGDTCPFSEGSALSGLAFYDGGAFPAAFEDALFFADSVRGCIYVMFPGEDGRPDPSTLTPFLSEAGPYPGIDLEVGPEGNLFYVSLFSEVGGDEFELGAVHRIAYFSGNQPPVARLKADNQWGITPLEVEFDATESSDADDDQLEYEWDLDGDGDFDPPTSSGTASETYGDKQNHTAAVRVSDGNGASSIDRLTVYPGNTPPQPEIAEPLSGLKWAVGEQIEFSGTAEDGEDGVLPSTSLDWSTRLFHCPEAKGCHGHPLLAFPTVDSGSFAAPDHDYPSHIELTLAAVDSRGLMAKQTVKIDPRTVELMISSNPLGVTIDAGLLTAPTPFPLTSIEGSNVLLAAPESAQLGGDTYAWQSWSDGGDRVHTVQADSPASYLATYAKVLPPLPPPPPPPPLDPPRTRIDRHPKKKTRSSTARFEFSASASGASFRCKLDSRPLRHCSPPRVYRNLRPGLHVFRVSAVGVDGKADPTPATFRWRVLPRD
jgi:glucose/arabinose dehydrogenase